MDLLISEQWLLLSIAAIAFIESLAFAGIVVPGVALLFAAAVAAGQNHVQIYYVLVSAYIGAVAGDLISYFLGQHAAPYVRQHWPFKNNPHWLEQGEDFFRKHGAFSVVLGRFIGPIRPVIPFIAGALQMRAGLFLGFNLLSALAWAPVYILPGYLLGSSSSTLNPQWLPLIYLIGSIVLMLLLFHKFHQWLQPEQYLAQRLVKLLYLRKLWPADKPIPVAAILLLISMSGLFSLFIGIQLSGVGEVWNQRVLNIFYSTPDNHPAIISTTLLGDLAFLAPLVAVCSACLYLYGLRRLAVGYLLLSTTACTVNILFKNLFAVARPETGQWLESFSFPSGHASAASAVLAMLAVLISRPLHQRLRRYIYLLFAIPVLGISISRVVLGVHWPLDSLTGLAEGLIFAALFRILSGLYGWQGHQTATTGISLSAITLPGAALYVALNLDSAMRLYGAAG
ncbi:MAG: bifunctional DedA family/phosphatase PAP2 family protein [Amphritea sp.]